MLPVIRSLPSATVIISFSIGWGQSTQKVPFIIATRDIPDLTDALIPLLK